MADAKKQAEGGGVRMKMGEYDVPEITLVAPEKNGVEFHAERPDGTVVYAAETLVIKGQAAPACGRCIQIEVGGQSIRIIVERASDFIAAVEEVAAALREIDAP